MSENSNTERAEALNGDETRTVVITVNIERANEILRLLFEAPVPDASEIDEIRLHIVENNT